ncbi:DUF4339 domain-containing protein [Mesorhizobium sp. BR115XR7A]|uniref:DUF4339 domain-containing protein n=1 Tax=Mesorhizobium sp. BR115XR7A TaxID=2876645 RepID=UPI001CCD9C2F|nr:DUF4339 domain-containing protein [Mesorhizobium sp. BR115XR7A]MBZ9907770.1 DUF4339 domain-containing protein [Mesorhizobium sp. BR115XR7A]MBZ9930429.1 DUF4339 domain-containing protein [Mesorhizobium sp. BR1-1-5]
MTEWYYEQDGAHRGPVSEADLNVMLANRLINASTRVWTASFGQQWKPAKETQLQTSQPTPPPPLPPVSGPPQLPGTAEKRRARTSASAIPEPSKAYAYLLAFLPLLGAVLVTAMAVAGGSDDLPRTINVVRFATLMVSLLLVFLDAKELRRVNIVSPTKVMLPFLLLIPAVYLLHRSFVMRLSWTPLWIWLGSFVVLLGVTGALMES